jgi:glycosyltransferase involved in cell wall biosynthesis
LIISEAEMTLLNDTFHVESYLLHYIPFIEDEITDQHIRSLSPYSERKDFVFIGNFIHEPNWKTVEVLKKTIWPRLKKELPQAELHIYGAYAPQKALQLHKPTEGFFIKGRAEDARLALEKYRVLLAPIPVGAGIKGKFVDAMYSGIPSVSSTIGAEGMTKNGLWNGCITDDADDFVRKSTRLYNSEEEWTSAQHIGFDLFNSSFTSKDYASDLLRMCRQLLENLHIHRQNNFIGQMLNHHSLQSAKYMSLWIEAKNKNARQT